MYKVFLVAFLINGCLGAPKEMVEKMKMKISTKNNVENVDNSDKMRDSRQVLSHVYYYSIPQQFYVPLPKKDMADKPVEQDKTIDGSDQIAQTKRKVYYPNPYFPFAAKQSENLEKSEMYEKMAEETMKYQYLPAYPQPVQFYPNPHPFKSVEGEKEMMENEMEQMEDNMEHNKQQMLQYYNPYYPFHQPMIVPFQPVKPMKSVEQEEHNREEVVVEAEQKMGLNDNVQQQFVPFHQVPFHQPVIVPYQPMKPMKSVEQDEHDQEEVAVEIEHKTAAKDNLQQQFFPFHQVPFHQPVIVPYQPVKAIKSFEQDQEEVAVEVEQKMAAKDNVQQQFVPFHHFQAPVVTIPHRYVHPVVPAHPFVAVAHPAVPEHQFVPLGPTRSQISKSEKNPIVPYVKEAQEPGAITA